MELCNVCDVLARHLTKHTATLTLIRWAVKSDWTDRTRQAVFSAPGCSITVIIPELRRYELAPGWPVTPPPLPIEKIQPTPLHTARS